MFEDVPRCSKVIAVDTNGKMDPNLIAGNESAPWNHLEPGAMVTCRMSSPSRRKARGAADDVCGGTVQGSICAVQHSCITNLSRHNLNLL